MPGWHKQTKKLVEQGKLSVAGIVQEQHPDRASLYMQWQQMDWPVLADPFNDLGIFVVPITLLIDEHGIIRYRNPKARELRNFLEIEYLNDSKEQSLQILPTSIEELEKLTSDKNLNSDDIARTHFRLGVAYRMRFDSNKSEPNDFEKAMKHWQIALEQNPNQYIWRRRIQQYGPRLDKPYSFYDWVVQARVDITKRGEEPKTLITEPSGAELALPEKGSRKNSSKNNLKQKHPDPRNKLTHDIKGLVSSKYVVVSSTNRKQAAVRIHLTLQPSDQTTWTNEAGNVSFHLASDMDVEVKDLKIPTLPNYESTTESRVIEFEIHPKAGKKLPDNIKAAAFYYVCTKTNDVCQFLRQDILFRLK